MKVPRAIVAAQSNESGFRRLTARRSQREREMPPCSITIDGQLSPGDESWPGAADEKLISPMD